jgi:hypothetical protein
MHKIPIIDEVWWSLDTRWGCGAVVTRGGVVVEAAPIFRRFIGQLIQDVAARGNYVLQPLALDNSRTRRAQ